MKAKLFSFTICMLFAIQNASSQNVTTVNATNSDISDNLDLRAVASIFGQAANLEDFERRLNNPREQISNLDLNNDGNVDYLRVFESVENRVHLVIIQAVLGNNNFQDVATVEVQRDDRNQVQVQIVGDVFMYGQNYIYEPIYINRPIIFNNFWNGNYNPYFSPYYWNAYPVYFSYWRPFPVFRYRRNVNLFINFNNRYNYANVRHCQASYLNYSSRRANGYEIINPNRSFSQRNGNVVNRYELDRNRNQTNRGTNTSRNNNYNNSRGEQNSRTVSSKTTSSRNIGDRSSNRNTTSRSNNAVKENISRDKQSNRNNSNQTRSSNSDSRNSQNSNNNASGRR